eukprot:c24390_g2_i1 orf=163-1032(+)
MRGFEIHGSSLQLLRMVAGKSGHLGPLSHPTAIGLNSTLSCFHPWQSPNFLGFWSRTKFLLHSKIAYQSILMMNKAQPVSWLSVGLLFTTGAGVIYYFDKEKQRRIEALKQKPEQDVSVGRAAIGGPFKLINHEGKLVTDQDFSGNWTLIYFGFTHCPDICPEELQKIVQAVDLIEKDSGIKITPVFISVDPERDNVEQIHEYVKEFHPRLVGLTGSVDDIKEVAREYRVYYMKTEEDESDYLVDHSIITYLMDPNMEFVKFFGKNYDVNSLSDEIVKEIRKVNASSTV